MTRRARIQPSKVDAFLDHAFRGREAYLRDIADDDGVAALVKEMVAALQRAGFKALGRPEVQQACLRWAAPKSPYVLARCGGGQ